MSKALAIVGARLNSSRLAGKHLLELAGKPLIEQLWRRLALCQEVNNFELATTADDFNKPLVNWAHAHKICCHPFEGDVNDLMARLDNIIQRQAPDFIIYICGDCPLIAPDFIDHALTRLKASGKDSIKLHDGVISIHEGMAFYSRKGWEKLMSVSQCAMSREHVGYADRITPVLDYLSIPDSANYSRIKHRISVDTQADYRFMEEVYRRWYKIHTVDTIVSLVWVQQQLLEDPMLAAINNHVKQKAANKLYAKASIYCHLGPSIGLGHYKRSKLIADALQEYLGIGAIVHVQYEGPQLEKTSPQLHWYKNENELLKAMILDPNPLIVIDLHPGFISLPALRKTLQPLGDKNTKIVGIDKLISMIDELDWLFIPSFNNSFQHPKVSVGWQNYLFPSMLQQTKKHQILVLTGGSDALDYGTILPTLLSKLCTDWPIIWVQGPLAPPPLLPLSSTISVLTDPDDLHELIAESEIILTCYGLSLFESIFSSAASILLPTQHLCDSVELELLIKEHCCLTSSSLPDAISKLEALLSDCNARQKLQKEASRVFNDHAGMINLMEDIQRLLEQSV
ncbi:cytidylyltransferase domain-containing protein [Shewanella baltica]|uniref:cytidylyltransferase domain-containing protein n=1 Tax=Shewanella baltica TaxID=62322 RepID=UPI00217E27E4|nr:acylneuraminate cytidylyltransferase [Shewanella baltica]MCS6181011.1 acylneuraminate cytidylyltransferase [Shewanella baltica]MCS6256500.1 acylneuraminate cytidylyltransferase [Shewanella baltica]